MIADLKPYVEYKESNQTWIGMVPAHWNMVPNRALMQDQRQVVGENATDYTLLSLTLTGIIPRNMDNPKGKFPAQFNTYKVVRPDDLVFCLFDIDETPRCIGHSKLKGMITGAYDVFSPRMSIIPRFLYLYYLFVDEGKLLKPLYTGLRKTIQRGVFASLKAPLPPLDEQAAIVRFLDYVNHRIDRTIRAKKKVIALLNEQKQAIIHRAVTRGLDPNVPLKPSGITWLGDIPKHWELVPNRSFMSLRKEVVGDRSKDYTLLSLSLRGVIARDMENPTGKWPSSFDTYQVVEPNDLIFCLFDIDETPRFVGLSKLNGMITGAYTVFRCKEHMVAEWAYMFYLAMDFDKRLKPAYTGLRKVIQKGTFLGLKLPMPSHDERGVILAEIANQTEGVNTTISRLECEIELLREYRTRLIADVVTGKLDVREAAKKLPDEAAESGIIDDSEISPEDEEMEENIDMEREES